MEQFYGERADEIAVQLAWHYEEAGIADQARHYLRRAGEQAAAQSAHAEAVDYLGRALAEDEVGRYALLGTCEQVYDLQGARQAQAEDLTALEELTASLADVQKQAEAALRRSAPIRYPVRHVGGGDLQLSLGRELSGDIVARGLYATARGHSVGLSLQLGQDIAHMALDRMNADAEFVRDFLIASTCRHQA